MSENVTLDSLKDLMLKWDPDFSVDELTQEHVSQINENLKGVGVTEKARSIWEVLWDSDLLMDEDEAMEEFIDFVLEEESEDGL